MRVYLCLVAGLVVLSGCESQRPAPLGPAPGDGTIKDLTAAATAGPATFRAPLDAALSPDGKTAYFVALAGDEAAVFRTPAPSSEPPALLAKGGRLVSPFGVDVSSDGATLVLADSSALPESDEGEPGALLVLSSSGGTPQPLAGTAGYRPRGVVVVKTASGDVVYFSGRERGTGEPGVFSVPLGGGTVSVVAKGGPFVEPSGLAVDAAGTVYTADVGDPDGQNARVLEVAQGTPRVFLANVAVGYPAGVALSQDEKTLLLSARHPQARTDAVVRAPVGGGEIELITGGIDAFEEPAGLHRARSADTYIWADSAANGGGTVYVINKQP